jgi:hypothetical protein
VFTAHRGLVIPKVSATAPVSLGHPCDARPVGSNETDHCRASATVVMSENLRQVCRLPAPTVGVGETVDPLRRVTRQGFM